jgi:hypothetical protein
MKKLSSYGMPYKRPPSPKLLAHLRKLNKSRRKAKPAKKRATAKAKE